jgi:hypothetical protein
MRLCLAKSFLISEAWSEISLLEEQRGYPCLAAS